MNHEALSIEDAFELAKTGTRVVVDWEDPPKSIGEQMFRHLWANEFNLKAESEGLPFRIRKNGTIIEGGGDA